jgi:ABC-type antimicrobial peptide transport system permease subunit
LTSLRAALRQALKGLGRRRRRAVLTGVGIALSAAMLSAAVVVSYSLGTGFSRAARAAGLPDIIARFDAEPASLIAARIRSLPDIARFSLRYEATGVELSFGSHASGAGVAEVLEQPGPGQGYALIAGRQLPAYGADALVERGLADAWGIRLGDSIDVGGLGPERVVGFVEAPDDVAYPLAAPRVYLARRALEARFGPERDPRVNLAEIWLRNARYVNEVLTAARSISYGLRDIRYATRAGLRVLLDQAAGIVIDLLVALSVIALITAGVLLAASARAEVQRRLKALGVRRAVGESRSQVALAQALEGLLVALPACTVGVAAGVLATAAPAAKLLTLLNEPPPGAALWPPLAGAWFAGLALPAAGAAWPAWLAAREPAVELLRGGELGRPRRRWRPLCGGELGRTPRRWRPLRIRAIAPAVLRRQRRSAWSGLGALGVRLAAARRTRLLATVLMLGLSTGFVLLMLALAAELNALQTDPGALGRRYQLTAALPPAAAAAARRIPGVRAAAPRYEVQAADSFALGESVAVVAYPGDHLIFEAPPLIAGRRLRGARQAEVGAGLANALGLSPGATLALALPNGRELRLRVSGVVSSLLDDGRVAYVPAAALLRADPGAPSQLAVVLAPDADQAAVARALARLGGAPASASGALVGSAAGPNGRGAPLVRVLRAILIAIAAVDGLVCLYALVQACALTVFERRRALAVLRACGAGWGGLARLLVGTTFALVLPAAALGVPLERYVFGPALSRLAEGYAVLPLAAHWTTVAVVLAGLALAAAIAAAWVALSASRAPVIEGLAAG